MRYFNPKRGRGRVPGSSPRRVSSFRPSTVELLESRQMLTAGPLGLNVEITPFASFVNLLQEGGNWAPAGQSSSIVLNASGDPESDAALVFDMRVNQGFDGPDPNAVPPDLSGTYSLTFNGQATIQTEYPGFSTPFSVQNQTYNATTNTTTASLVVPANNDLDFFGISFLNTQATPNSATNTGFNNASLIRPGYTANSTQLYSNEFLAALEPYSVLRYLDDDNANGQPFFNGNTLVTVNASQVDQTGQPWEYLVALANQSQTDMWINVPEGATNDYVTALADIIKNGGTVNGVNYAGLDSNLKVYLEYSNEVWGGIPNNEYYQEAAVQNSATNQPLSTFPSNVDIYDNTDGTTTTDVNTAVGRRYLEETYNISQIFQSVLGSDPTHGRIRPVLGWQEDNPSFFPAALDWFEHYFGPASSAFYGMGNAIYESPTTYSSVSAILDSMTASQPEAIENTVDYTTLATFYGLKNVSYEGGPFIVGDGTSAGDLNALAASRDPAIEQVIYQNYVNFYAAGGNVAAYFNGPYGIWSPQNEWDEAELSQYGDPTLSPKYRASVDLADAAPVPVTAGVQASPTAPTTFSATVDSLGTNFSDPVTGTQGYWLLNTASAGTYDLKLSASAYSGTVPSQLEVILNDKEVNSVATTTSGSLIDLGNLSLSAGLNTVSVVVTSASGAPGGLFLPSNFTLVPAGVAAPKLPTIVGAGFESPIQAAGQYTIDPSGSGWSFSGSAGIADDGSGFTDSNGSAPQGTQVAYLEKTGSFSESVTGWAAGTYAISFAAAQRGGSTPSVEDFEVLVDGNVVGTIKPTSTIYQSYSTNAFTVTAGSHTIEFLGLDTAGGDNTALIDAVSVAPSTPTAVAISDPGFETELVGTTGYIYNPTSSAWTFTGAAGVAGNGNGFTNGDPSAPQGTQVAFLQDTGSLSQPVAGWAAGSYTISFDAAQRGGFDPSAQDFEVLVDGNIVGTFQPTHTIYQTYTTPSFNVTAGSHTIEFLGLDTEGGDNTAFIDAVTDASSTPVPPTPPTPPTVPTVGDPGFESVAVGGGYKYDPTGSAWTFSGGVGSGSGVAGNDSGFTAGNPPAPQGTQVAFLQAKGTITQSIAGWAAGSYAISFDAAQRGNFGTSAEDFEILVDGQVVGTFKPTGTSYQVYTTPAFTVTAGSHTIEFLGLDTVGGDNTAFLDDVAVATATPSTVPTVGDLGFESVAVGGGYKYDPTGSAWTFSGGVGSGSGVAGNDSGFTAGNPPAPQGTQVAFLQAKGTITQSIAGWAAGSYAISFDAAQRGNFGTSAEDFEILVDGQVVGTFKPTGTSYQVYTTPAFTVTAGSHTIEFLGLDTVGGDNTAFLDDVTVETSTTQSTPAPPTLSDASFESEAVGAGQFLYDPTGSPWTYFGGSGVSGNGSNFTSGNPKAPDGSQVAFLQKTGSISQSVYSWPAGSYSISFEAAQRANFGTSAEDFEVLVDGTVVGTFKPTGTSYQASSTASFTVSAGTHTIEFLGLDSVGGDNTAFIDDVEIE